MTHTQFQTKIRSLMKSTRAAILYECDSLLSSGAFDLAAADNDYRLPKMILYIAMQNAAEGWTPLSWTKDEKRILRHLRRSPHHN